MIPRILLLTLLISTAIASSAAAANINQHWAVTFDERVRLETWDNAITLEENANSSVTYTRTRTRLGAIWSPSSNIALGLRLANEFRYCLAPTNADFNLNEVFVDHLYLRMTLPYSPLTFTIGRQDVMLGEGFIVFDGNPLDGSRSAYFNALRVDWTSQSSHRLTAFACYQEEKDNWLPIIREVNQALIEQPETGLGLYYSGKWLQRELQFYLVHISRGDNTAFPDKSRTITFGGRIEQPVVRSIDLTAVMEAGYQIGKKADADRRAYGGYGYLKYCPKWKSPRFYLPERIATGVIYLSGDKAGTDTQEGWDPMFARWPKWSEGFIYTQILEDEVAWWTNLVSFNAEAQFHLTPGADLKLTFHHLLAPQKADGLASFPGGTGNTRGELCIGKLSYKFDQHWTGHLLCEYFDPRNYYFDDADSYAWIRAELMFQY